MSTIFINAALILNGNISSNGDVMVSPTGIITPVPLPDLKKTVYSYQTNSYITSNGVGCSITSSEGGIDIEGLIDGRGQGFDADSGPGNNSLKVNNLDTQLIGYGASHAGLGSIKPAINTTVPVPSTTYGFHESPVSLGSGGGFYHNPNVLYSTNTKGGGAIKLVARSGVINIDGNIFMDGQSGSITGGGAGGSIWLIGWHVQGFGILSTQGGACGLSVDGGGGSGGYVSLWYENTNNFNGTLLINGKSGGGDGKIFIKQIEPILEERFTGTVWNTKWWTVQNDVTLNNNVSLTSPQDDFTIPVVESLFNVSGKNITAAIDYIPGSEIQQYASKFLLYADSSNWVGLARKSFGLFGISSANGLMSSSGIPVGDIDMSFRLVKTDSTFSFQFYDSTSLAPSTIYSDVRPELANKAFKIRMELTKPVDGTTIEYLRPTPLDLSNQYVQLDSTVLDVTSTALNLVGGFPQAYGTDYYVTGNQLRWDTSSDLTSLLDTGDVMRIIYGYDLQTINAVDATFDSFRITEGVIRGAETVEPIIYVDSDYGSDSSDGLQLTPIKNLFVATAWSKKGGTVVLYDGTYNPTYVARKDITIRGAEGVKPLITSINSQDTTGSGWENNALSFYACQGLVENVQIADSTVGIRVEDADKFIVNRTLIHDVSTAISFVNCDPTVSRNRIYSASTGIDFTTCISADVNSNVIHDTKIGFHAGDTINILFVGNTIDACEVAVSIDSSSNGAISSNNLTDCTVGYQVSSDSSVSSSFNNYYNDATAYSKIPDSITLGDIFLNPLYLNRFGPPEGKDYHIDSASPNIGAGENIFDSQLIDFDGVNRT